MPTVGASTQRAMKTGGRHRPPPCRVVRSSLALCRLWATCGWPSECSTPPQTPWHPSLIPSDGDSSIGEYRFDHHQCGIALRGSRRRQYLDIGHQPVPVLRQHMAAVTQFRFLTRALPYQHGIRIGRGLVRVVGRSSPWKYTVGLPGSSGASPVVCPTSLKLFKLAHTSSSEPCSSDSRFSPLACSTTK